MMKKKDELEDEYPEGKDFEWLNPANDPKTPYTEEELKKFAEGFAESMSDTKAFQDLKEKLGSEKALEFVKEKFEKQDENSLANIPIKGSKH